jgi:plastocyanin
MRLATFITLLGAAAIARAGDVQGVVSYAGAAQVRASLPVTKDKRACGEDVPDESLVAVGGRLANVVVTVKGGPAPAPRAAVLDQQRCRFIPHVQAVPVGSTLDVKNGDPLLHNVHGWVGLMSRLNVPMPEKGMTVPARLDRVGTVAVRCDVHGWMSAWIVVSDAPSAVSGADGGFSIAGVPPGSYAVTAWHERLGERTAQVTVPAQGSARVDFQFGVSEAPR